MQHKIPLLFFRTRKNSHHREIKIKYKSRSQRILKSSTDYIQHTIFINLHYVGFNHTLTAAQIALHKHTKGSQP